MSSADGITWTSRTAAEANLWRAVCWSNTTGLFVAVAKTGTNRVMTSAGTEISFLSVGSNAGTLAAVGVNAAYTSANGSSWTSRTIPAGTYNKVIYADSLFVAVGASKCATSPDGITWTARTIPAGTWLGLAYSSTLDLFVAVGDNLLCTSPDGITWTTRTAIADQAWQAVAWSSTLAQFFAVSLDGDNRIASSTDGINWQILTTQADYSFSYLDGPTSSIEHGTNQVHFISRDETASVNTSGDTAYPAWNLGYLESTASAPGTLSDPFYKFFLQKAPLRLDVTDGDRVHFEPSWVLDPTQAIDAMIVIVEVFDSKASPAWYQEMRSLALFDSVEGGSLPSTIERVAAYTPLVSSGFDGNLTSSVNNLQALAEAVDDLPTSYTPPATTAANDFQVGNGSGNWIKKTLAQTITILRTSLDSIYAALTHTHAASDITSGTLANARLDTDLGAIGDLSPANDDIIQRKSGAWTNRTLAQLSTDMTELIQDIVGAMFSGNTETGITATYQDSDGTIDLEVSGDSSGWIAVSDTWTRTGNHTFTISGDVTAIYQKGTKIRYKDGGSFEYGVIISSSYSAPNTTVTLATNNDYAMAAATITDTAISYTENPQGFPSFFNFSPSFTGFSVAPTVIYRFAIVGSVCIINITTTTGGTSNATNFKMTIPVTSKNITSPGNYYQYGTAPFAKDNGATIGSAIAWTTPNSSDLTVEKSAASPNWTNSGTKYADIKIFVEF